MRIIFLFISTSNQKHSVDLKRPPKPLMPPSLKSHLHRDLADFSPKTAAKVEKTCISSWFPYSWMHLKIVVLLWKISEILPWKLAKPSTSRALKHTFQPRGHGWALVGQGQGGSVWRGGRVKMRSLVTWSASSVSHDSGWWWWWCWWWWWWWRYLFTAQLFPRKEGDLEKNPMCNLQPLEWLLGGNVHSPRFSRSVAPLSANIGTVETCLNIWEGQSQQGARIFQRFPHFVAGEDNGGVSSENKTHPDVSYLYYPICLQPAQLFLNHLVPLQVGRIRRKIARAEFGSWGLWWFLCGEAVEVGRLSHCLWDFQETSPGGFLELNMNFNVDHGASQVRLRCWSMITSWCIGWVWPFHSLAGFRAILRHSRPTITLWLSISTTFFWGKVDKDRRDRRDLPKIHRHRI